MFNKIISSSLRFVPKFIINNVASRYIAGEALNNAIETTKNLNQRGMLVTLDLLGEDITSSNECNNIAKECEQILNSIAHFRLNANLSLKLTQLGLKIDFELCRKNLISILKTAKRYNNFVRIDMEDSTCTDKTLEMFYDVHKTFDNCGVVIQACLRRSEEDVKKLVKNKINVRLCKGIYNEPENIAFKNPDEIRENYNMLLRKLFEGKSYIGIATHDDVLIKDAIKYISEKKKNLHEYEFQMLLGVRSEKRDELVKNGFPLRIYTPYGKDWYAYSIRRLKENPQIAMHVTKAIFTNK